MCIQKKYIHIQYILGMTIDCRIAKRLIEICLHNLFIKKKLWPEEVDTCVEVS